MSIERFRPEPRVINLAPSLTSFVGVDGAGEIAVLQAIPRLFGTAWAAQWRAFPGRDRMTVAPDAFAATATDLRVFSMPVLVGLNEERIWSPNGASSAEQQSMRHSGAINCPVPSGSARLIKTKAMIAAFGGKHG